MATETIPSAEPQQQKPIERQIGPLEATVNERYEAEADRNPMEDLSQTYDRIVREVTGKKGRIALDEEIAESDIDYKLARAGISNDEVVASGRSKGFVVSLLALGNSVDEVRAKMSEPESKPTQREINVHTAYPADKFYEKH